MKVRITDLLDRYYDKSVKLDPPPQAMPGQYTPQPRRRGQKPLLVAATLMLVVTGIAGLTFGFQRLGVTGHALAGEESPASVQEEAAVETVEPMPEPIPEPAPEPTIAASAWEDDPEAGVPSVLVTTYLQQGGQMDFAIRFYPAPELDYYDVSAVSVDTSETMENITLQAVINSEGTLLLGGQADLPEECSELAFRVQLDCGDGTMLASEPVGIPCAPQDSYVMEKASGIYEYVPAGIDPPVITVTRIEVRSQELRFILRAPVDDYDMRSNMGKWIDELRAKVDSKLLYVIMKDGSTVNLETTFSTGGQTMDDPEPDGSQYFELRLDLANPIDPLEIESVGFQGIVEETEAEETAEAEETTDTNGETYYFQ